MITTLVLVPLIAPGIAALALSHWVPGGGLLPLCLAGQHLARPACIGHGLIPTYPHHWLPRSVELCVLPVSVRLPTLLLLHLPTRLGPICSLGIAACVDERLVLCIGHRKAVQIIATQPEFVLGMLTVRGLGVIISTAHQETPSRDVDHPLWCQAPQIVIYRLVSLQARQLHPGCPLYRLREMEYISPTRSEGPSFNDRLPLPPPLAARWLLYCRQPRFQIVPQEAIRLSVRRSQIRL